MALGGGDGTRRPQLGPAPQRGPQPGAQLPGVHQYQAHPPTGTPPRPPPSQAPAPPDLRPRCPEVPRGWRPAGLGDTGGGTQAAARASPPCVPAEGAYFWGFGGGGGLELGSSWEVRSDTVLTATHHPGSIPGALPRREGNNRLRGPLHGRLEVPPVKITNPSRERPAEQLPLTSLLLFFCSLVCCSRTFP